MEFPCLCCCWHGGLLCVLVSACLSKTPAMSVCPHCLWCELSTWSCQAAPWVALLPREFAKLSWKLNTICISGEFLLLGTSGQVGEVSKTALLWAFWHFQPPPVNRMKTDEEFIARSVWELLLRSWFPNSSKVGFRSCLNVRINQMLVAHVTPTTFHRRNMNSLGGNVDNQGSTVFCTQYCFLQQWPSLQKWSCYNLALPTRFTLLALFVPMKPFHHNPHTALCLAGFHLLFFLNNNPCNISLLRWVKKGLIQQFSYCHSFGRRKSQEIGYRG